MDLVAADAEIEAGEHCHDVIQSLELWLPASFQETWTGEEHATWVTPSGIPSGRVDFVAIAQTWRQNSVPSKNRARQRPDCW